MSLDIPSDKCLFGIYHAPQQDYMNELIGIEKDLDFKFEIIMDYYSFNVPFSQAKERMQTLYDDNRVMLVTLQPFVSRSVKDFDGACLIPRIVNGEYDSFLYQWANGLKTIGQPVFLRFGNEMNGDWDDWCSWFYSLDPDLYILAWDRIYTIFNMVGANNVYFVWNPHDRTYPNYNWNKEFLYYPGDSKVDWIGLTAYNNGVTRSNEQWREFDECYTQVYLEYMTKYHSKPFMITEFASNEVGGDKAQWITQGFPLLQQKFPNIRIAIWWNGIDDTWIYKIDSSFQAEQAFKQALTNPYFQFNAIK
jgi:mannan endo-1,4-beta-mannosidase